jgi:hypothetical protein
MSRMMRIADRLLLLAAAAVPKRAAAHCLNLLRQHPALADRWGYHVRPIHYYEPLPDFRAINREELERRRIPRGIPFDLEAQARRVDELASRFAPELRALQTEGAFDFENEYFSGHDAAIYYALIRDLRPARVIEIGAGYSTQIASRAFEANKRQGAPGLLTVIEPYPQPRLTQAGVNMDLIAKPVEQVEAALFQSLRANDILFIDSSHVLRVGGDVFHEFLEILPQLNPGVWVHVHDIFFPFDYPAAWVIDQRLAFNEQYLLEAFLAFNERFVPELSNYWLSTDHPAAMQRLFPARVSADRAARAASFWMRRR